MTDLVPSQDIERLVGATRHDTMHIGHANSQQQTVYILHSHQCLATGNDLRTCTFSQALDHGINLTQWTDYEDRPVALAVINDRLVPLVDLTTQGPHND